MNWTKISYFAFASNEDRDISLTEPQVWKQSITLIKHCTYRPINVFPKPCLRLILCENNSYCSIA